MVVSKSGILEHTGGDLDGRQSQDSPGTVRVTLAYRDTLTEGDIWMGGSPRIVPGLSELLWHTGIS